MMDKSQALNLIRQIVEAYRGTFADHQQLQVALKVLEEPAP